MKKLVLLLTLAFLFGGIYEEAYAQKRRKPSTRSRKRSKSGRGKLSAYGKGKKFPKIYKYLTFGGGVGYGNYFGDLAPSTSKLSTSFHPNTPYLGAFATKRLNNILTVRGQVGWTRLFSNDNDVDPASSLSAGGRYLRGLHFRSQVFEANVGIMVDLLPTNKGAQRRPLLNPYFTLGLGLFYNNPQALGPKGTKYADNWYNLLPLKTGGQGSPGNPDVASKVQLSIPIGLGVRYRLNDLMDVGLEFGYRFCFTNTIDDVSSDYAQLKDLDFEMSLRFHSIYFQVFLSHQNVDS
jgi:hypothetical protein